MGICVLCGAPSRTRFSRVKVPNPPGSGKDIAEGKGVHCEVESEEMIQHQDNKVLLIS